MNTIDNTSADQHGHSFLGRDHDANARRTTWVVALTFAMMVGEVIAGYITGSMALLADGFHMATHAGALGIAAAAYGYAKRHADDRAFSFGTGKVGELAGFASALILGVVALVIGVESALRLVNPTSVAFGEATVIAIIGLLVNIVSAMLLSGGHSHGGHHHGHHHHSHGHHAHDHGTQGGHRHVHQEGGGYEPHSHEHQGQEQSSHEQVAHEHSAQRHRDAAHGQDNNLRSAYLHVMADALTSVLAILALLAGRYLGWVWLDPVMGIVGAVVIARWAWTLMRDTSSVLLDATDDHVAQEVRDALKSCAGTTITDLHVWQIGPQARAVIVSVKAAAGITASEIRSRLAVIDEIRHLTVEVAPG